ITPDGTVSPFVTTPNFNYIAIDSHDNLYATTWDGNANNNGEILEFDTSGHEVTYTRNGQPNQHFVDGPTNFPSSRIMAPFWLAFDASDNLFATVVTGSGYGEIREFDTSGTEVTYTVNGQPNQHFATGLMNAAKGLTFDKVHGDLFVAESGVPGMP